MKDGTPISRERALEVYLRVFGEAGDDDRADSIEEHFRRLAQASTIEEAEQVIGWWHCWVPDGGTLRLRPTIRRLRLLGSPDVLHKVALMRPRRKVFTGSLGPVEAFLVGEAG